MAVWLSCALQILISFWNCLLLKVVLIKPVECGAIPKKVKRNNNNDKLFARWDI